MQPYYKDDYATIYHGDCRDVLRSLPDGFVHCCVTSPPYFGLRDYGTAQWEGGGADCDHKQKSGGERGSLLQGGDQRGRSEYAYRDTCRKCGASRIDQQLGLEQTPDEYVAQMVSVFREVRRVLRDDGTLWLNLGDSYAGGGFGGHPDNKAAQGAMGRSVNKGGTLKPKDLIGIPWRVAFALQADGWWLRQDIIWHKPNPMPESVRDRCTKSHEYIFLLSKSAKYWYDADAVMEDAVRPGDVQTFGGQKALTNDIPASDPRYRNGHEQWGRTHIQGDKRNRRSVWTISTNPYKDAHFATFPPKLIEPCILAGCPEGGTVLDPFVGSGTTVMVANQLKRKAIGIDLNIEYLELAGKRTSNNQIRLIV
jgi:DNA modification methylase